MLPDTFTIQLEIPKDVVARIELICTKRRLSLSDIFLLFVERNMPMHDDCGLDGEKGQTEITQDEEDLVIDKIRAIIQEHGRLSASVKDFQLHAKLGLSSFAAVQVMIALEEHFEVEFSDEILGLYRFDSIRTILSLLRDAGVKETLAATV